jgi:lysophospholipase L1-like esterase
MKKEILDKRRDFLKKIVAFTATTSFTPQFLNATAANGDNDGEGFTFLFQGDSITDGNRTRDNDWNHVMGHGYQYIIASKLWYELPEKGFHFFNRGVSGNKVTDLTERWQKDTLELKPDVLSILIGINDISAFVYSNREFTAEKYETGFRSLLKQTKEQLPGVKFILCEPFILPVGKVKDKWDDYFSELKKRHASVLKLSQEFNAVFVPFQSAFDKALSKAPAEYWIWDGIHPMPAGHELMAEKWLHEVSTKLKFIKPYKNA